MRAKSIERVQKVVRDSISEIDVYHQQFKKEAWIKGIESNLSWTLQELQMKTVTPNNGDADAENKAVTFFSGKKPSSELLYRRSETLLAK